MNQPKPQISLRPFPPDELEAFNKELQALCDKYSAQVDSRAVINDNGTIGSQLFAVKRVELVPKEEGMAVAKPSVAEGSVNVKAERTAGTVKVPKK